MKKSWSPARVLDASDRGYSDAILPLLAKARKEIFISLYLMEPVDTAPAAHPVNRLIEALLSAQSRGVKVQMVLNTNFRFLPKNRVGTGSYFLRLFESGVQITALLPNRRLHDKLIIIDRRYVVDGSMNWSVTALMSNFESATIIDSRAYAELKLQRCALLTQPAAPKARSIDRAFLQTPEFVELPLELFDKEFFPAMVSSSDERSFDLYMILAGQAAAAKKPEVILDLETTAKALKLPASWPRSTQRRQIIKVLRKLESRYKLVKISFPYAEDARVELVRLEGAVISLPGWIFEANYVANQSSGAVFLALCGELLKTEGKDIQQISAPELRRRFGVGKNTLLRARRAVK